MQPVARAILFLLATLGLAWLSRASLRDRRSHGFYRLIAWEAIVALFLINVDHWFDAPFSARQLLAWLLLLLSAALVLLSVNLLRKRGRIDSTRRDPSLLPLEKTTELVTTGVYRYIRHPMYASLLFLEWGILLKHVAWLTLLLAVVATGMLFITARVEEQENLHVFGERYLEYMGGTKMFLPFLF